MEDLEEEVERYVSEKIKVDIQRVAFSVIKDMSLSIGFSVSVLFFTVLLNIVNAVRIYNPLLLPFSIPKDTLSTIVMNMTFPAALIFACYAVYNVYDLMRFKINRTFYEEYNKYFKKKN